MKYSNIACSMTLKLFGASFLLAVYVILANFSAQAQRAVKGLQLRNPFCDIPTFIHPRIRNQAQASINEDGQPVIYIAPAQVAGNKSYLAFLMAHECCHHTRGHFERLAQKQRNKALLALNFVNQSLELDADCCAAVALARMGNQLAVHEAARRMAAYGPLPTGAAGYPAGLMRAALINQCAMPADSRGQ